MVGHDVARSPVAAAGSRTGGRCSRSTWRGATGQPSRIRAYVGARSWARRPGRRRPLRASRARHRRRRRRRRPRAEPRRAGAADPLAGRGDRARHRLRDRGPQARGPVRQPPGARQRDRGGAPALPRPASCAPGPSARGRAPCSTASAGRPVARCAGQRALRRQPAEGGAGAGADAGAQGADLRRADPRRRRRRQGRDLRHPDPARGRAASGSS